MITPELHYLPHAVVTALLGGLGWLAKYFGGRLMDEWDEVKGRLANIETSTKVQAENHLAHIEAESVKQTELLGKIIEGQAEMNGWLKGQAAVREVPPVVSRLRRR